MSRLYRGTPLLVWVKVVTCITLLSLLFFVAGLRLVHGQAQYNLVITGNSDLISFTLCRTSTTPITIYLGVSGQPMSSQTLDFSATNFVDVVPPVGTVSIFVNVPGINILTDLIPLSSDGWYQVPAAVHQITISGDTNLVRFTTNYTPTVPIYATWGVSNIPAVTQVLTFTNKVANVTPPTHTVSLLFAPPSVVVSTTFTSLGAGWYSVPSPVIPPVVYDHYIYIPFLQR